MDKCSTIIRVPKIFVPQVAQGLQAHCPDLIGYEDVFERLVLALLKDMTEFWPLGSINDCTFKDLSVKVLKCADNTTVICLIWHDEKLVLWNSPNTLELNTVKIMEQTEDFWGNPQHCSPLPYWTRLWWLWSFWEPRSLRNSSGNPTLILLPKMPIKGCISCDSWKIPVSTTGAFYHRSCWTSSTQLCSRPLSVVLLCNQQWAE